MKNKTSKFITKGEEIDPNLLEYFELKGEDYYRVYARVVNTNGRELWRTRVSGLRFDDLIHQITYQIPVSYYNNMDEFVNGVTKILSDDESNYVNKLYKKKIRKQKLEQLNKIK